MSLDFHRWRHVFKLDPARQLSDQALELVCLSGTNAIIVGGSSDVTYDNTVDLLARVRRYELPCILEISSAEAIVPGFDLYFIPIVLNSNRVDWITGHHHQALREYGALLDWSLIVTEGYIILNEASTAAIVTEAKCNVDEKDLVAYARMADKLFHCPIVYLEYSGTFGNMDFVRRAAGVLQEGRLFYGGGIDHPDKAREAAEAAHTIVVGNVIYEDLRQALATVEAVAAVKRQ